MRYRTILLIAVMAAAAAAAGRTDGATRVAGDRKTLWLAVYDPDKNSTRVAGRAAGEEVWLTVTRGARGAPSAVHAAEGKLHVFYGGGGHQIYQLGRRGGQIGYWPNGYQGCTALAACSVRGQGAGDTFLVLLSSPSSAATEPTASAPATQAAATAPARTRPAPTASAPTTFAASRPADTLATRPAVTPPGGGPVLFATQAGRWHKVSIVPCGSLPETVTFHMADAPGGVYVLATALGLPIWQGRFEGADTYRTGHWVTLPGLQWKADDGGIRQVLSTRSDVWLFGGKEGPDKDKPLQAYLRRLDSLTGTLAGDPVPVTRDGQPLALPAGGDLAAGEYDDKFAIAWGHGDTRQAGLLDLGGVIRHPSTFDVREGDGAIRTVATVLQWTIIGLPVLLLVGLFYRWQGHSAEPFLLPPPLIPAMGPKRLLAFALDFLPFLFIAVQVAVGAEGPHGGQTQSFFERLQSFSDRMHEVREEDIQDPRLIKTALAALAALVMHATYATIMEAFTGRTVGKTLLRLRVFGSKGRRPSLAACAVRNFTKVTELFCPLPWLFLLWPLFTGYRQRAGDMVAATAVVDVAMTLRMQALTGGPGAPPEGPDDPGGDDSPKDQRDQ